jgi:hypothetical protein
MKGKEKNDFNMTFYDGEQKRLFMEYVHDANKMLDWSKFKKNKWTHAMIYNRRTRGKN